MKKTIFVLILALLLSACFISALKTGIVIESDDNAYYDCVSINSGDSVYNLLKTLDTQRNDIDMTINGELTGMYYLKSVNGLSDKIDGSKYYGWSFFIVNEDEDDFTSPINLGIGDYKITKEESIGIKYGYEEYVNPPFDWTVKTSPEKPKFVSFNQLCNNPSVNVTKVYVDGKIQTGLSESGGKLKNVVPGSNIELRIRFENLYRGSTDINIEGISVEATFEEVDNGADMVKSIHEFDLGPSRDETKILNFTVPYNADSNDKLLVVEITARDSVGIEYDKTLTYDVQIQKKDDQIMITNAKMNKESYSCGENSLLSLSMANMGKNAEKVQLLILNEELGVNINERIDMGNDPNIPSGRYDQIFNIMIPSGIDAKAYTLPVRVIYAGKEDDETVSLTVNNCGGTIKPVVEQNEGQANISVQAENPAAEKNNSGERIPVISSEPIITTSQNADKNLYYLIAGITIITLSLIAALIVMFLVLRK